MKRVKGIGGIFFKSDDPKNLYAGTKNILGLKPVPTREPLRMARCAKPRD
jgi:hypothetical protein